MHFEAAKLLSFAEDEFMKALDWGKSWTPRKSAKRRLHALKKNNNKFVVECVVE